MDQSLLTSLTYEISLEMWAGLHWSLKNSLTHKTAFVLGLKEALWFLLERLVLRRNTSSLDGIDLAFKLKCAVSIVTSDPPEDR